MYLNWSFRVSRMPITEKKGPKIVLIVSAFLSKYFRMISIIYLLKCYFIYLCEVLIFLWNIR